MMCLRLIYLVCKTTRTVLENKEDMYDSDVNVSGCEIRVNYLNAYTWVFSYIGVSTHSNKHTVFWICNHWEKSTAAFTSVCEAPDHLQIWKALYHGVSKM